MFSTLQTTSVVRYFPDVIQGLYDGQHVAQTQGQWQGAHYPQADAGQHALHSGSQPMQGQGFQYSKPDASHGLYD